MKKFVCSVCGYVHEGETAPEFCPICKAPKEKFVEQSAERTWAAEHVVGVAQGAPEEILQGLRENFVGECTEVGMYLAMARVAHREGYPEIGEYWRRAALEEAEHAAKFAELLGEVLTDSTKKNLEMRVDAENGATMGKFELAKKAKELNLDAIHDTVHEMARDEARHGKAFEGLLSATSPNQLNSDPRSPGIFLPWRVSSTQAFLPRQKSWRRRNLLPPSILIQMGPHRTCPVGRDCHGKAFEGLLKRCFSST